MRTYTITFRKPGAQAVAELRYVWQGWPKSVTWHGSRDAFRLSDGRPLQMRCTMDMVDRTAQHQARQAGATYEIQDDAGPVRLAENDLKPWS